MYSGLAQARSELNSGTNYYNYILIANVSSEHIFHRSCIYAITQVHVVSHFDNCLQFKLNLRYTESKAVILQ